MCLYGRLSASVVLGDCYLERWLLISSLDDARPSVVYLRAARLGDDEGSFDHFCSEFRVRSGLISLPGTVRFSVISDSDEQ
jgi:hypothetical protein